MWRALSTSSEEEGARTAANKLDIVIPTLNDTAWLSQLLDCLLRQQLSEVRTFVVFDVEEEIKLAESHWSIPGISAISAPRGIGSARNSGAKAGIGNWILFLDADDLLPDCFITDLMKILLTDHPSAATFSFYADSFDPLKRAGTRICWWYLWAGQRFGGAALPGFATLVKRTVFTEIGGYRNDLAIGEDYAFSDDVLAAGHSIKLYRNPWLVYSVRRFDLPPHKKLALLWRYLVIDLSRRINSRRYLIGDIAYEFGKHEPPARRRTPQHLMKRISRPNKAERQ